MITCDTVTAKKVEAELKTLEMDFKLAQSEQKRKLRGAVMYLGVIAPETLRERKALDRLQEAHSRRARKLRALLAVLKEEQPATVTAVQSAATPAEKEE